MQCEDCHEREANIHLTQVIEGKKTVLNLCSKCAEKRGFHNPLKNVPFPLGDFLSSMVDKPTEETKGALEHLRCRTCGLTFSEFSRTGRLGCGDCYHAFGKQLDELLRKIHGSNRHVGNLPFGNTEKMEPIKRERKLREELRKAIESEDFEKAAELRDELKEMASTEER